IEHTTGIPYSPTGQAIIERTHKTLKGLLERQKGGSELNSPIVRLSQALFTLKFLNCTFEEPDPPVLRHFSNDTRAKLKEKAPVLIRDPETKEVQGP
ncbi:POK8 protein, partial [Rhagologus leucostigma]|nr:POK8 protein [Rhagologus leucostigma]